MRRSENDKCTMKLDPSATATLMLPAAGSVAIDHLIGLNLADRTIYGQEAILDRQADLLTEDSRDQTSVDIIGASDLCESEQKTAKFDSQLDVVVDCLDKLLRIQEKRIDHMVILEKLGLNMDGKLNLLLGRIVLTFIQPKEQRYMTECVK